MRKVIATTFASLDGVMQAPGGPGEDTDGGFSHGGWVFPFWDDLMSSIMDAAMQQPFDLLLGRRTYDVFAAHWPRIGDEDAVARRFNATTKHVATSSPDTLNWKNSEALRGNIEAAVAKLKHGEGPDLLLQGSSQLTQTLLRHDLIDVFNLWIFPVVLGRGKRLFGDGAIPAAMKLAGSQTSSTGVLIANYVRAGEVETGSFALE